MPRLDSSSLQADLPSNMAGPPRPFNRGSNYRAMAELHDAGCNKGKNQGRMEHRILLSRISLLATAIIKSKTSTFAFLVVTDSCTMLPGVRSKDGWGKRRIGFIQKCTLSLAWFYCHWMWDNAPVQCRACLGWIWCLNWTIRELFCLLIRHGEEGVDNKTCEKVTAE